MIGLAAGMAQDSSERAPTALISLLLWLPCFKQLSSADAISVSSSTFSMMESGSVHHSVQPSAIPTGWGEQHLSMAAILWLFFGVNPTLPPTGKSNLSSDGRKVWSHFGMMYDGRGLASHNAMGCCSISALRVRMPERVSLEALPHTQTLEMHIDLYQTAGVRSAMACLLLAPVTLHFVHS